MPGTVTLASWTLNLHICMFHAGITLQQSAPSQMTFMLQYLCAQKWKSLISQPITSDKIHIQAFFSMSAERQLQRPWEMEDTLGLEQVLPLHFSTVRIKQNHFSCFVVLTFVHWNSLLVFTKYAPARQPMHDRAHAGSTYVPTGHCWKTSLSNKVSCLFYNTLRIAWVRALWCVCENDYMWKFTWIYTSYKEHTIAIKSCSLWYSWLWALFAFYLPVLNLVSQQHSWEESLLRKWHGNPDIWIR